MTWILHRAREKAVALSLILMSVVRTKHPQAKGQPANIGEFSTLTDIVHLSIPLKLEAMFYWPSISKTNQWLLKNFCEACFCGGFCS